MTSCKAKVSVKVIDLKVSVKVMDVKVSVHELEQQLEDSKVDGDTLIFPYKAKVSVMVMDLRSVLRS